MGSDRKPAGGPPEDASEALGRAIRVLRTERGLNRKELAEVSGVSYPYLSEIEGGRKSPSPKVMQRVAEALDVRPSDLMVEADRLAIGPPSWPSPPRAATSDMLAGPESRAALLLEDGEESYRKGQGHQTWSRKTSPRTRHRIVILERLIRDLPEEEIDILIDMAQSLLVRRQRPEPPDGSGPP